MSGPGRVETFLRDCFDRFPGAIETYAWLEDIDLSAAAAAICAMKGSMYDGLYVGTDSIRTRKGFGTPHLLGIMGIDEAGGGTDGYLTVAGRTRAIRFGKLSVVAAGEYWLMSFLDNPVLLPEGNKLDCVGNKSGAGAEQHAVIVVVGYPDLPRHPELTPEAIIGPVGLKTGTRVADTFGPKTSDLLGSNLAYEDSEESLSEDPDLLYALLGLINGPGLADTSVVGVRYSKTKSPDAPDLELYIPASMAGSECYWLWPSIAFSPENPAKLGAGGKSTTSDEYGLHIGSNAPYGDMDLAGQQRKAVSTSSGASRGAGASKAKQLGRGMTSLIRRRG